MMYKRHPKFQSYLIGEDGSVTRDRPIIIEPSFKPLRGRFTKGGYRQFMLVDDDGKKYYVAANRLICAAFHGPPPTRRHQAAHLDGKNTNDVPSNLGWKTPRENALDRYFHGTVLRGVKHHSTKITPETVNRIRKEFKNRRGDIIRLASRYRVSETHVRRILSRESWTYL